MPPETPKKEDKDKTVTITIDRGEFVVGDKKLTGAQLRQLPSPPIGNDRDLFQEVPGPGDDQKIGDDTVVHLKDGMHFYTGPSNINLG